ncbi:YscQ/HrcQ family type III secretion apparatus protein [Chromobacterium violaceum]|uniref:YscQ/HrcQ family type III secretion apparatus protein n=1 Tax=Chromobacterium violaceum TaxID=536 RepID=UPI000C124975|nr:YscQ/HrcQ family type III secretion apparatus protein [Chromobacterium violaceum]ATP29025.1 YscQ/HrcQ family type III secretion apparatus protein [Chromobacterium violaceum]ATP32934.1 YscQ/HrcQ family type III secretion apparatus protein [Chromobacterium violaceum]
MRLALRQVDGAALALRRCAEAWAGQDVRIAYPPSHGCWLKVAGADGSWQGWLQPRAWLRHMAPELASLASAAGMDDRLSELIAACEAPLSWPVADMPLGHIVAGERREGSQLPQRPMLRMDTPQGEVWLEKAPAPAEAARDRVPGWLPMPLRFLLGDSMVSPSLLRRAKAGDVLLISRPAQTVSCNGRAIGTYQWTEEGIIMEWQNEMAAAAETRPLADLDRLPVRLEFVLQQSEVTLDELRELCRSNVLPLSADAERRVELRANGALLGRGELVQLDGRLGVEVAQWLGGSGDVE